MFEQHYLQRFGKFALPNLLRYTVFHVLNAGEVLSNQVLNFICWVRTLNANLVEVFLGQAKSSSKLLRNSP